MINLQQIVADHGLQTKSHVIDDGKIHRFHVNGDKPSSKNGWYVFFDHGDFVAGKFGSWKIGETHKWCSREYHELTPQQRQEYSTKMAEAKKLQQAEAKQVRFEAQQRAQSIWVLAPKAANDHPYFKTKGGQNHGLKLHDNRLVIPLYDAENTLHSIQYIDANGQKRFLAGGRKKGCFYQIGTVIDTQPLYFAEGYAPAASIYEALDCTAPVFVAFDAGNLLPVGESLRVLYPSAEMIFCADNDHGNPQNTGLTKAKQAAQILGGYYTYPTMSPESEAQYA